MHTKPSTRIWGVFAVLVILLTACESANLPERILGQWESTADTLGTTAIFDFQEEGVLVISIEGVPINATYNWEDDNTIKMNISLMGQSDEIIGDVRIEGDQLIITADGNVETFTRIK